MTDTSKPTASTPPGTFAADAYHPEAVEAKVAGSLGRALEGRRDHETVFHVHQLVEAPPDQQRAAREVKTEQGSTASGRPPERNLS